MSRHGVIGAPPPGSRGGREAAPVTAAPQTASAPSRLALAAVAGLSVGAGTSAAQTLLGGFALAGLANAVSPWVMAPFFLGATGRSRGSAVVLGTAACLASVAGYYLVSALRGFGVNPTTVLIWSLAALIAGSVFGLAGHHWATARARTRGLGAALLVAVWASEAVVTYGVVLGYVDDAVVFGAIAVLLFMLLGRRDRQHAAILAWLVPAVMLGAAGTLTLHAIV